MEQIDLQDPLSDPQVASLYFGRTGHGAADPAVLAAKDKVNKYFERLAPESEAVVAAVEDEPTREEMGLPPEEPAPYDVAADLQRDGYVGLVPELVAEMTPKLYEMLDTYGGRDSAHVQKMAVAMGELEGAQAWAELERIATKYPEWASDKKLRAKIIKLNQTVDAATLRIFSKLG